MNRYRPLTCVAVALMLALAPALRAEPVSARHGNLDLPGHLSSVSPSGLADGVVVLVHGTLAHARMELIASLQSLLAERGINSLAITLSLALSSREGMYDCSAPHGHRHHDALEEIGVWLDFLSERGARTVWLAGHSRGGNQVARFAAANPGRVHGLVLIAPGTHDPGRSSAEYERRHGVPLQRVVEQARRAAPGAWLDDVGFLYCGPSRVTAEAFLSYHADDGDNDTPSLLPRIGVPTLVIAGNTDDTVTDVPERTRARLDADTQLLVVDGADHFFRDLFAEDVADAIAAFMQQHAP